MSIFVLILKCIIFFRTFHLFSDDPLRWWLHRIGTTSQTNITEEDGSEIPSV